MRGTVIGWDGAAMASVGRSLWYHHSLKECCHGFGAFPKDPSPYAKFGIGMSLVTAPLWGIDHHETLHNAVWVALASPLLLAATSAVIARTALVLGWRRSTAALCAFAFAFGTMVVVYSQTLYAESGVTLGAAIALLGYATWWRGQTRQGAWLLGAGVAVAALFRPDSIALVGLITICVMFFCPPRKLLEQRTEWLAGLVVPIAFVMAWTLLYNQVRFGSIFDFGYSGPYDTKGFSTPLFDGIGLQLWSPGKSFFLYSPILALAIPGLVFMWRRQRPLAAMIVVVCVARTLFYARWWTPVGGGAGWGPRFLLPLCALLAVPVGALIERLHGRRSATRIIAAVSSVLLAACAIAVQAAGIATEWPAAEHSALVTRDIPVAARLHHLEWSLDGSPLRHAFTMFGRSWTPTYWFGQGRTPLGLAFAFSAIALCLLAVASPFGSEQSSVGNRPRGREPRDGDR